MGRTQTNGPADYDAVHEVQDGYTLTPLSQWGTSYKPPAESPIDPAVDGTTPPLVQVGKLDGVTMLSRLAELMKRYPPHPNDYPILFRARAFGIEPGKDFDPTPPPSRRSTTAPGKRRPTWSSGSRRWDRTSTGGR